MLTPYQIRKDEEFDFDECSQLRSTIEKNRKKRKTFFKTNVLVPKIYVRRKRAPQSRRLTYLSQRAASLFVYRPDRQRSSMETFNFTGKPHKIPQMSYLRYETKRRRFLDIHSD